jgi:hypothetical protein
MARHAIRALDRTAESLAAGQPVPKEAIAAMEQPMMPALLYALAGGLGWWMQALRSGAFLRLGATPFADGPEPSGQSIGGTAAAPPLEPVKTHS